ncbi:MAG: regulatory protein RecX [Ferruginibacter sp.]
MEYQQKFTPQQALVKARHYCAYQERCHMEVKEKLYGFGLNSNETDQLLSTLIEEDFLNEERFAIAYAGGHFRTKYWGKVKISHALKQKQVSPFCIKKALQQIDEEDYIKTLQKLFDEKLRTLKNEKNLFVKKHKLQDHLIRKGFETNLVRELTTGVR